MKRLLFFLLIILMLSAPAMAAQYDRTNLIPWETTEILSGDVISYTYDASRDEMRISGITLTMVGDSYLNFTIYYGDGQTVDGSVQSDYELLSGLNPSRTTNTVTLNSVSKSYSFLDVVPQLELKLVGYAKDTNVTPETTGFLVYDPGYGMWDNDLAVFYQVDNIGANTIYRIDVTGSKPFRCNVRVGDPATVSAGSSKSILDVAGEWVQFAIGIGGTILAIVTAIYTWGKFFLWDHLVLTIALYIGITGAMAFNQSRDIFQALKKFFGYQMALYMGIITIWEKLISLVSMFRGIFKI